MKVPLSWLKDYLSISLTPAQIAHTLTMIGIEVDHYESSVAFQGVQCALIIDTNPHPHRENLFIATIFDGKQTHQVVCGAANCRAGLKTAFAPIGAILSKGTSEEKRIQKTVIQGVESQGILCSAKELGLSEEHFGILELPSTITEGILLQEIYDDTIFDISLTPNLNHCHSIFGIARELSAALNIPLNPLTCHLQESPKLTSEALKVTVLNPEHCPYYACRVIQNVKVGPSPLWLKGRLEKCGIRSINNIVDVTNYILLEMGQPLHTFDYNTLVNHHLIVKNGEKGIHFIGLDDKERILTENDILIYDEKQPVALAGIMGGSTSEVSSNTTQVALEAAYFHPLAIRKTCRRLALHTEASKQFEKGIDPNQITLALNRAAYLIAQFSEGTILKDPIIISSISFSKLTIKCRLSYINHILGLNLSQEEILSILARLQFAVQSCESNIITVEIPTYRADIKAEIDLVEEIARFYGYQNIPHHAKPSLPSSLPSPETFIFEKKLKEILVGQGLQEFVTCNLIGPTLLSLLPKDARFEEKAVQVINPTSIEQSILRTSFLPGLLQIAKYNIDHQIHDIRSFEIGKLYLQEENTYKELSCLSLLATGKMTPLHWKIKPLEWDFFHMKGVIENLLAELKISSPSFKNLSLSIFHNGRQASLFLNDHLLGHIGEVHPSIQRKLDVKQRLFFAEIFLEKLYELSQKAHFIQPLPLYPCSDRDWTITLPTKIPVDHLFALIQKYAPPSLKFSLIDRYVNPNLGTEYHNLSLRFTYRDPHKTILNTEVDEIHTHLVQKVTEELKLFDNKL